MQFIIRYSIHVHMRSIINIVVKKLLIHRVETVIRSTE